MALLLLGFLLLATIDYQSSYFDVAWRSVILGFAVGLCFTSFPTMVLGEIPHTKVGVGSGTFNTARQIGFALGVAILISIFTGQIKGNITTASANSIQIVNQSASLPEQVRARIVSGLQATGEQTADRSSRNPNQFDLTTLADQIPGGQALKPELTRLNSQIGDQFLAATVKAFTFTWLIAALVALVGLVTAFFVKAPPRHAVHWQTEDSPDKPAIVDVA
jgi:hypothetical protein